VKDDYIEWFESKSQVERQLDVRGCLEELDDLEL
jgi:hypothetical protein